MSFDKTRLKTVHAKAKELVEERNLLAHGCWTNNPKHGWLVREDRGAWASSKGGPSGSRKVTPQSRFRDPTKIAVTVSKIESLIEDTIAFQDTLAWPS